MHRILGDAFAPRRTNQRVEQAEIVDLRFESIFEERVQRAHLRIHDQNAGGDSRFAEFHALVGHRHGQIVHAEILQCAGHFYTAAAVGTGLDHASDFGLGAHERAVETQIVGQRAEIHLEGGFVHFEQEFVGDLFERKISRPFEENHVVRERVEQAAVEQRAGVVEEMGFRFDLSVEAAHVGAHADEQIHLAGSQECGHAAVEHLGVDARLLEVAQYQHRAVVGLFATCQEVERDVERGEVGIIGVVDERQAAHALFHLQPHGHGSEVRHAFADLCGGEMEFQADHGGVDGIFDRGLVVKGNVEGHDALPVAVVESNVRRVVRRVRCAADGGGVSGGRNHLSVEGGLGRAPRPADAPTCIVRSVETTIDERIVHTVDQRGGMLEEFEFLHALFVGSGKIGLMCRTDIGEHTEGGTNDVAQGAHFARATDAGFE